MLNWFWSLIGSVARGLRWCVVTGVSTVEAYGGALLVGMWRGLFPPPPPVLDEREAGDLERVVELLADRQGAHRDHARRESDIDMPIRQTVIDPAVERASRERALRYTTAVIHGGDRPSLSGVAPAVAHRLRKLTTPAEAAPIHRGLMKVLGVECTEGWWDGPLSHHEILAPDPDDPAVALHI